MSSQSENRRTIIGMYIGNVHGKMPDTSGFDQGHDGREGHWLERQMGIAANADNKADILGHEMKNTTESKTSYGDWNADYYIYKDNQYDTFKDTGSKTSRDMFMEIFGQPSASHEGKYSWSGKPIPKINQVNSFGAELIIDGAKNVLIRYYFSKDTRENKHTLVPAEFQKEGLIIVRWDAGSLEAKVNNKFNKMGWFKCMKGKDGKYNSIVFGDPMSYELWLRHVANGDIFFDSGMHQGNPRNYSMWRASNSFWEKLVTERYP